MEKQRLWKSLITAGAVLLAGLAYYGWIRLTGWGIPCIFNMVTGLHCPGCGVSRMCIALLELDLYGAFRANALVLLMLPFGLVIGARKWLSYVKTGRAGEYRGETALAAAALVLTLAFWVLRNLPAFSFLAPQ